MSEKMLTERIERLRAIKYPRLHVRQNALDLGHKGDSYLEQIVSQEYQPGDGGKLLENYELLLSTFNTMVDELESQAALIEKKDRALEKISNQMLTSEMDEDQLEHADFEGGWDTIIEVARAALTNPHPPKEER